MRRVYGKNKGFVEGYFLYLLSIICILCSLQMSVISKSCNILMKLKEVNKYTWDKILVLNWINNNLIDITDGSYEYQGISFDIRVVDKTLYIYLPSNNIEIKVLIDGNKLVKII